MATGYRIPHLAGYAAKIALDRRDPVIGNRSNTLPLITLIY